MQNRIKELRRVLGLKQEEFGTRIGAKQSTITAYECGNRTPMDTTILAICKEFNVNEVWLRTGEGEMFNAIPEDAELQFLFGAFLARLTSDGDSDEMLQAKAALIKEILRLTPEQVKGVVDFGARLAADLDKVKKEQP